MARARGILTRMSWLLFTLVFVKGEQCWFWSGFLLCQLCNPCFLHSLPTTNLLQKRNGQLKVPCDINICVHSKRHLKGPRHFPPQMVLDVAHPSASAVCNQRLWRCVSQQRIVQHKSATLLCSTLICSAVKRSLPLSLCTLHLAAIKVIHSEERVLNRGVY